MQRPRIRTLQHGGTKKTKQRIAALNETMALKATGSLMMLWATAFAVQPNTTTAKTNCSSGGNAEFSACCWLVVAARQRFQGLQRLWASTATQLPGVVSMCLPGRHGWQF
jgi:hypothetical protein